MSLLITDKNHPGFSLKTQQSPFHDAMTEIEDAFNQMIAGIINLQLVCFAKNRWT